VPSGNLQQLPAWAGDLLEAARVGHLGLSDGDGCPRVLPITYAVCDGAAWTAVDNKPKQPGRGPARVRWLRERPHAALTVDRYEDNWSELRWVQILGQMAVLDGPPAGPGLDALVRRYPQYQTDPPPGPLLRLSITRVLWWRAG
jgi:PPOX class probable F420-dependent enzyme